jgi:hypothetical protein
MLAGEFPEGTAIAIDETEGEITFGIEEVGTEASTDTEAVGEAQKASGKSEKETVVS